MPASRRLLALVGAALAIAVGAVAAGPARGAGNPILQECQSNGQLTHAYTVKQLRHALAVMPATVKQYTNCYDVVQNALVSARKHGGTAPATGGKGGGSSFLSTPVIIIIVVVLLAGVTYGALVLRRRRAGIDEDHHADEPSGEAPTRVDERPKDERPTRVQERPGDEPH